MEKYCIFIQSKNFGLGISVLNAECLVIPVHRCGVVLNDYSGAWAFSVEIATARRIEKKNAAGKEIVQMNVSRHGWCESPP
jgi:hypothetical protein